MKRNLYTDIPANLPEELITTLVQSRHVRVERIVSDGHSSPEDFWYDQKQDEWVLLLSGSAVLSFEENQAESQEELTPGDYLFITAHRRHRVESTSADEKTVWLAVHFL